jgi:hypothetical protein
MYLPASSPLFTYSQGGNYTGTWKGVSLSRPTSQGGGTFNSSTEASVWTISPGGASSNVSSARQTGGQAAVSLDNVYRKRSFAYTSAPTDISVTDFTPIFDAAPAYTPSLQSPDSTPPEPWKSGESFSQPFSLVSSLTLAITCSDLSACPSTPFTFQGATIGTEVAPPSTPSVKRAVADDASGLIHYSGWSAAGANTGVIVPGPADYGGTLSITASGNASAIVKFKGESLHIFKPYMTTAF